ncbi:MAG: hypothetical protein M3340_01365 [Actinomycetota bacterium]|nr:hypothetical protein [Actinomycetota bacterium]
MTRKSRDLSRLELLAVWARLWTAPRDVEVPPVPWRRIAYGAVLLAVALTAAAVVAVPAIDSSKDETAERERRELERERAAKRERLVAEQAPQRGSVRRGAPRAEVIRGLERAIGADARVRVRTGRLRGPILRVECDPARRGGGVYECLAVTSDIAAGERNVSGAVGHPFVAAVDFARGRFTWCKANLVPGEGAVHDRHAIVGLPAECTR